MDKSFQIIQRDYAKRLANKFNIGYYVVGAIYAGTPDKRGIRGFISKKRALDYIQESGLFKIAETERVFFVENAIMPLVESGLVTKILGIPTHVIMETSWV